MNMKCRPTYLIFLGLLRVDHCSAKFGMEFRREMRGILAKLIVSLTNFLMWCWIEGLCSSKALQMGARKCITLSLHGCSHRFKFHGVVKVDHRSCITHSN